MTIGEEVLIHGYIDEIRKDIVIIRNEGGYFGTVPEEIRSSSEIPNTCGDAISRQAALDVTWEEPSYTDALNVLTEVRDKVKVLPSVTPQQRTGQWRKVSMDKYIQHSTYYYECSECGDQHIGQVNYCPHCGAKMEVEE